MCVCGGGVKLHQNRGGRANCTKSEGGGELDMWGTQARSQDLFGVGAYSGEGYAYFAIGFPLPLTRVEICIGLSAKRIVFLSILHSAF